MNTNNANAPYDARCIFLCQYWHPAIAKVFTHPKIYFVICLANPCKLKTSLYNGSRSTTIIYTKRACKMNKSEKRELITIDYAYRCNMLDTVALSLSALIRSCLNSKSRAEMLARASLYRVDQHPQFKI